LKLNRGNFDFIISCCKTGLTKKNSRLEREEAERLKRQAAEREEKLLLNQKEEREDNLRRPILDDSIQIFEGMG
jgi:hypothetical protein